MQPPAPLPTLTPTMSFDEASAVVVDFLKRHVPLGYWAVTRFDGRQQLYLAVRDDAYGLAAGDAHDWDDSFCVRMVAGEGPQIAPDAMRVPAYATAGVAQAIPIGAYVGIPISNADGGLFGTLCGLDPVAQSTGLEAHAPLLTLLAGLLSMILAADVMRTTQARALERAELAADTDPLTGLLSRRGWQRILDIEEDRYRRFGDPGSVIVVDLDRLKEINDTLGHAEGDRHIVRAGAALRGCVRETDYVARLGGDEFAVLASLTTPEQTEALVERIYEAFAHADVTGSVGHAPYTICAGFPGAFEVADAAMYEEKTRRRGSSGRRRPQPARS